MDRSFRRFVYAVAVAVVAGLVADAIKDRVKG